MADQRGFHVYSLKGAHPKVLGETLLVVSVLRLDSGQWVGKYQMLTQSDGAALPIGEITCEESNLKQVMEIEALSDFLAGETVNFVYGAEIAPLLEDAAKRLGQEIVFSTLPNFVRTEQSAIAGAYMRGLFSDKWKLLKQTAPQELSAYLDAVFRLPRFVKT